MISGRAAATPDAPAVTAVVPTVGRSPWLADSLAALRAQRGAGAIEILVVDQADAPLALPPGLADRILRPGRTLGFAGGTNLGIAAARGDFVATVNDDALVAPDWIAILTATLLADPAAAAAQGVNLLLHQPARLDGCGLGWNAWWQAVQLGHDAELADLATLSAAPPLPHALEIFGVSATAALFRRAALEQVALAAGQVFDPRLVSYYEDAELAGRLRAAGFRALLAPHARAHHGGSASSHPASRERWRLIYANRYLAAARLLGSAFWTRLPRMVCRDLADILSPLRSTGRHEPHHRERVAGVALGWLRAARLLPTFARLGAPLPPPAVVARLSRLPADPG
jgi:GT2 family glycosyltransferase